MEFKDYYAVLGVDRKASQAAIKHAYRKLARKYHPDVSKEPDTESRFKQVAEAHEALIDPERRAAYDDLSRRHADAKARGQPFEPPPDWGDGFEFSGAGDPSYGGADHSDFFEGLFGRTGRPSRGRPRGGRATAAGARPLQGADHHARIEIALEDLFSGAGRTISLSHPEFDAQGHVSLRSRQLEVNIPAGLRPGQRMRLVGQGEPGEPGAAAGDLFLEIELKAHPRYRVDGADLWLDLLVAPWEAALGARVAVATPQGEVDLSVPAGSMPGRKLRLRGRGLPGTPPGDLYAHLRVVLPPADTDAARQAYAALARAFPTFQARPGKVA